jgi:hypothetical protein
MSEHTSAQLCPMYHAAACSSFAHHVLALCSVTTWQQLCSMQAILRGVIRSSIGELPSAAGCLLQCCGMDNNQVVSCICSGCRASKCYHAGALLIHAAAGRAAIRSLAQLWHELEALYTTREEQQAGNRHDGMQRPAVQRRTRISSPGMASAIRRRTGRPLMGLRIVSRLSAGKQGPSTAAGSAMVHQQHHRGHHISLRGC